MPYSVPAMHQILKGLEMSLPTNILEQLPTLWVTVECWDNSEGVGVNAKRRDGGRGGGISKNGSPAEPCEAVIVWEKRGDFLKAKGTDLEI